MNDDWNGAARQGFKWGVARAARRNARPAPPGTPGELPEGGVRLLLVTEDEPLAAAVVSRLQAAGHAVQWRRQLPPESPCLDHELLAIDGALWRAAEATGFSGTGPSLPTMLLDGPAPVAGGSAAAIDDLVESVLSWAERTAVGTRQRLMGGELLVDIDRQFIQLNGVAVELTPLEWQVITLLARRADRIVSRAEIAQLIGGDAAASDNAVAVHLYNLRRKLGRHAIETIRGRGFRLRP
jgi:DNA-binding response OmpR family regulator